MVGLLSFALGLYGCYGHSSASEASRAMNLPVCLGLIAIGLFTLKSELRVRISPVRGPRWIFIVVGVILWSCSLTIQIIY